MILNTLAVIVMSFLLFGCQNAEYETSIELRTEKINGSTCSLRVTKTIRKFDGKVIAELKQLSNFENSKSIMEHMGIQKSDGFVEISVDSVFYNDQGYDTLKNEYSKQNDIWKKRIILIKKYNRDNQIFFYNIKYLFNGIDRKTIYTYNSANQLESEIQIEKEDSIYKKKYFLSKNKIDSVSEFIYKGGFWEMYKPT
jgi:hypothetical protein